MIESAKRSGATILGIQKHKFQPEGVTILILLQESHVSMHTYPNLNFDEDSFCSIDAYTCGETCKPELTINYLIKQLKPTNFSIKILKRGNKNGIEVIK